MNKETKQQSESLIEKYKSLIEETDFHVPEFISGIKLDSIGYAVVLMEETNSLAIQCAILEVKSKIDLLKDTKTKLQKEYLECENHLEQQGYANCNMLLSIELNQQKEILKYLETL